MVSVTDGNTIVILDGNNPRRMICLQGIDVPERGQAYGTKSLKHLSDPIAGKSVGVEYQMLDCYERNLGKYSPAARTLTKKEVRAGLAVTTRNTWLSRPSLTG